MATPDPVLDLTTDRTRPTVRIDAVEYPLRNSHDLTLDAYKALERISPRISVLLLLEAVTSAQARELSHLLDQVCRLALVAPPAVHEALGDVHRVGIFQVFMELLMPSLPGASRATAAAPRLTGRKRSPGFSGSIQAAPRAPGSRKRPSASSGRA